LPATGLLNVGRVGKPHGLDGTFHVTRPRTRLLSAAENVVIDGTPIEILRLGGTETRPTLKLAGWGSREQVERSRGQDLWVDGANAPELEEDEWLAEDLEGCSVRDGRTEVGVVTRLLSYPSCDLLEVSLPAGAKPARSVLVPLISDAVRSVDVRKREIDIDLEFLGEEA
jgi:16S rRNA processing protein RimM